MEFLQLRRELIARAALGIGKNQQHAASAKFFKTEFAAIEARATEAGRRGAGFQAIAIETASRQGSALAFSTRINGEFPLSQLLFEGFEPQQNAAILPEQLPTQPSAQADPERRQRQQEIGR
jgi:hypothetical protein